MKMKTKKRRTVLLITKRLTGEEISALSMVSKRFLKYVVITTSYIKNAVNWLGDFDVVLIDEEFAKDENLSSIKSETFEMGIPTSFCSVYKDSVGNFSRVRRAGV